MNQKKIRISLNPDSIDDGIYVLGEYKKRLSVWAKEIVDALASVGFYQATVGFGDAIYDGTNDVSLEYVDEDNKLLIKASGETVMFIEFGTGVYYPDNYPADVKARVPEVVGRGEYGKGHGKQNTWAYYGDNPGTNGWTKPKKPGLIFTHGNPANMPMYNAAKEMRNEILNIAKDVFAQDF